MQINNLTIIDNKALFDKIKGLTQSDDHWFKFVMGLDNSTRTNNRLVSKPIIRVLNQ